MNKKNLIIVVLVILLVLVSGICIGMVVNQKTSDSKSENVQSGAIEDKNKKLEKLEYTLPSEGKRSSDDTEYILKVDDYTELHYDIFIDDNFSSAYDALANYVKQWKEFTKFYKETIDGKEWDVCYGNYEGTDGNYWGYIEYAIKYENHIYIVQIAFCVDMDYALRDKLDRDKVTNYKDEIVNSLKFN